MIIDTITLYRGDRHIICNVGDAERWKAEGWATKSQDAPPVPPAEPPAAKPVEKPSKSKK